MHLMGARSSAGVFLFIAMLKWKHFYSLIMKDYQLLDASRVTLKEQRRSVSLSDIRDIVLNTEDEKALERKEILALIQEELRKDAVFLREAVSESSSESFRQDKNKEFAVFLILSEYFSYKYQEIFLAVQMDFASYKQQQELMEIYEVIRRVIAEYRAAYGERFIFFLGECTTDPAQGRDIFSSTAAWDSFINYYYLEEIEKGEESKIEIDAQIMIAFDGWLQNNLRDYLLGTSQMLSDPSSALVYILKGMSLYIGFTQDGGEVVETISERVILLIEAERDELADTLKREAQSDVDRVRIERMHSTMESREQITQAVERALSLQR